MATHAANLDAKTPPHLVSSTEQEGSPRVVTAIWDGSRLEAGDVKRLASLPSRPVLLSRVIAGVQAPITGLATSLSQILACLVYALEAIKEKKSGN